MAQWVEAAATKLNGPAPRRWRHSPHTPHRPSPSVHRALHSILSTTRTRCCPHLSPQLSGDRGRRIWSSKSSASAQELGASLGYMRPSQNYKHPAQCPAQSENGKQWPGPWLPVLPQHTPFSVAMGSNCTASVSPSGNEC